MLRHEELRSDQAAIFDARHAGGRTGQEACEDPHLNDTPRERNDYEEWRPFYRKHFADEYAVYEAALKRNDELLKRYPSLASYSTANGRRCCAAWAIRCASHQHSSSKPSAPV